MKNPLTAAFLILVFAAISLAGGIAEQRAGRMGPGMNLSFLENYWNGTRAKHYSDFVRPEEVQAAKDRLGVIYRSRFRTVRIPVNFSAWASMSPPYDWESPELPEPADRVVEWALYEGLNVIIDLHHPELDGTFPTAVSTARMVELWKRIAGRYKHLDPERVFFEIRNEPHGIPAATWRAQAEAIIAAIRKIAPEHTLVVGFHDWNGREAMIASLPFGDPNIIYTFHYYHPFVFTHQGATWVGDGIPDLRNVPFPGTAATVIKVPPASEGTWVEQQILSYRFDANESYISGQLKEAKAWSLQHEVPIFLGEMGSYGQFAGAADRCRHARALYDALGSYRIPSAWWEWFAGFNMLDGEAPNQCMRDAVKDYDIALGTNN